METLKIKTIQTTEKEVETEIILPAYYKTSDEKDFYKITSKSEYQNIHIQGSLNWHDSSKYSKDKIQRIAGDDVIITEQEWIEAVKKYSEKAHQFVLEQGLTSDGLPLPTPEMFGLDKNGNKIKRDENLIES